MAYIIDKKGNKVGKENYKNIQNYSEGFAAFENMGGKWGMLDLDGNVAIPPIYEESWGFMGGLCAVKLNGKWGFINKQNEFIIACNYDRVHNFFEGFASVKLGDYWAIINIEGTAITKFKYKYICSFSEGFASVGVGNRWTCVNTLGIELFKPVYKFIRPFLNGYSSVLNVYNKSGVIDKNGEVVIPFEYENIHYFQEGLLAVSKKRLWGFLDSKSNVVIPFQFDEVHGGFKNGYCIVTKGKYKGIIDKTGKTVIPFVMKDIVSLETFQTKPTLNVLAIVSLDRCKAHISRDKKIVEGFDAEQLNPKYIDPYIYYAYGIIRIMDSKIILPFKYTRIRAFSNELAQVEFCSKTGYVNHKGKWAIPISDYGFASEFYDERAIVDLEFYGPL